MPLLLEFDEKVIQKYQDPNRKDGFAELPLTREQSEMVLYHKVESVSDKRSDTQHDPNHPWHDGPFVGLPPVVMDALQKYPEYDGKIMVNGGVVGEDHGMILHFHGRPIRNFGGTPTPGGIVHADRDGDIITPQQAMAKAITSNRIAPKYRMWEFRLWKAIWTDGPERRARLQETAEAQRARSEERMANSITSAFDNFRAHLGNLGQQPTNINQMGPSSPQELMDALTEAVKKGDILPEQARASFDFAMDEVEMAMKKESKRNGK